MWLNTRLESTICYTIMAEIITGYMMHPQTKKSESSQTSHIKYHRQYPRYTVNQEPNINNNWKVYSECYWWHSYLPDIQHSLHQWGAHHSLFVWQEASQTIIVNKWIDMKWQIKTHSGSQRILHIWCAHPKTTKYWKWWTRVK